MSNTHPKTPLFCLIAPTASGKTSLAHQLIEKGRQQQIPIEIISLDSALIYKDMNIGTAKPSAIELQNYPYHLVDICSPIEHYDVAHFLKDAAAAIQDIYQRGAIPIVVGGTMMYYKALSEGLNDLPAQNADIRQMLENQAQAKGWNALHDELSKIDPITAKNIQSHDRQRIQRALEIYHITGTAPHLFFEQQTKSSPYECLTYTLNIPRPTLHQRIEARFLEMLDQGLLEEIKFIQEKYPSWNPQHSSMRAVGYRQSCEYLSGTIDYKTLIDQGCAATRQLAKRQITWLRQLPALHLSLEGDLYFEDAEDAGKNAFNALWEGVLKIKDMLDTL